jgi:hypothetical protein
VLLAILKNSYFEKETIMKEDNTERSFDLEVKTLFDNLLKYAQLALDEKYDNILYEFDKEHPTLEK